jgi:uncharacterized protein YbaR (Trm112 family)
MVCKTLSPRPPLSTPPWRQVHVLEGALVCPNCSRRYPLHRGVPNMLLREDEV